MKINKNKFIQLLKEGLENETEQLKIDLDTSALEEKLDSLIAKFEELDISLDYLTAALTGDDPLDIDIGQTSMGRLARPRRDKGPDREITP
jgi:hypothetical protein